MIGRELCRKFYAEAVKPLLGDLPHSAGLLGPGSEVLGFDDTTSTDHHFGLRVLLFVGDNDIERAPEIVETLARGLPPRFAGWWTSFTPPDPNDNLVQHPVDPGSGPINHRVEVHALAAWTLGYLGFDAGTEPSVGDWVATPSQLLATIVDAAIYHDGLNVLGPLQDRLRWYPDDFWRYLLAAQWRRISQEEAFVGRTAQVGDELGSYLLAARLARDLIRLAFLVERRHAPYAKWIGTAFSRLLIAGELQPSLHAAVAASTYADREAGLVAAYEIAMKATNALELGPPFDTDVREFYLRGFLVTMGDRISAALRSAITDPDVLALPPHRGSIDQFVDSTDVLSYPAMLRRVAR